MAEHLRLTQIETKKLQKKLNEYRDMEMQRGSLANKSSFDDDDIRVYNFKEPDKFSKAQLQTLHMLFENFAREASTQIGTLTHVACDMEVKGADQQSFQEFLRNMADLTVINTFYMKPLDGQAILEISPEIVFSILERMAGGVAKNVKIRDLTIVERQIWRTIMESLFNTMSQSLDSIDKFTISLDQIETNKQFIQQIVPPMEICVKIRMEIRVGTNSSGVINIVLPFIMLESIVSKLSSSSHLMAYKRKSSGVDNNKNIEKLSSNMNNSVVDFSVEIGRTTLSLGQLEDLLVGDVIVLNKKKYETLEGFIGDEKLCLVKPFVREGMKVVKIEEVLTDLN